MTPLLADESLSGNIISGLRDRVPDCDLVTIREADLLGEDDRTILEWAAARDRVLVASDQRTMPGFAYERVAAGKRMPGLIVVPQQMPIGAAIIELELVSQCGLPGEWENQVDYLPLR